MINFLLLTLVSYAISYNLVNKEGPFDILKNLRSLMGIIDKVETVESSYGILVTNTTRQVENNFLAKLFSCQICLSIWVCLLSSILYYLFPEILPIFYPFAMWGIIIILVERKHE
jgi:hypothetical protein